MGPGRQAAGDVHGLGKRVRMHACMHACRSGSACVHACMLVGVQVRMCATCRQAGRCIRTDQQMSCRQD